MGGEGVGEGREREERGRVESAEAIVVVGRAFFAGGLGRWLEREEAERGVSTTLGAGEGEDGWACFGADVSVLVFVLGTVGGSGTSSSAKSSKSSSSSSSDERAETPESAEEAPALPGPEVPAFKNRDSIVARRESFSLSLNNLVEEA